HGFARFTAGNQIVSKGTVFGQLGVSLSDDVIAFFNSRQVIDLFTDLAVNNLAVRRFQETVLVQTSVQRHGVDQTNVWTFRRFNRAHATVVGWVHVAHLKARTFTSQTTRAQCRNTTLVRDLGQRVGLIHKLRQLAGTEELLDSRRDGLGVDQIVRHQVFGLGLAQTFLDGTFHTHQTGAELVFGQFAHATNTTVRSEEHTSELQSRENLVCRLLLEKKNE